MAGNERYSKADRVLLVLGALGLVLGIAALGLSISFVESAGGFRAALDLLSGLF